MLKAQADLQRAQTDLPKVQAERNAIQARFQLKLECLRRESEARVAAATMSAGNTAQAQRSTAQASKDDEDLQGEVPPEVSDIFLQFVGLPQEEIVKIFQNKFKPINFYRLRHMRGLTFEAYQEKERIGIENGMLKLRKTLGLYKDYGSSFFEVWSEAFINYTSILVSLFRAIAPCLQRSLTQFYGLILQLSRVYDWKKALLPLAIKVHSQIVTHQPSDPKQWVIPPEFQGKFCTPTTVIGMNSLLGSSAKRKRSKSPTRQSARTTESSTNNPSVVCDAFNKGLCTWGRCERSHKCRGCVSRKHGVGSCTKKK